MVSPSPFEYLYLDTTQTRPANTNFHLYFDLKGQRIGFFFFKAEEIICLKSKETILIHIFPLINIMSIIFSQQILCDKLLLAVTSGQERNF